MIRPTRRGRARAGLTLIEILVSILILSVVSIAMIGILMVSSELFRRGEYSRSSNDEAIAVMGTLDDDVKRIIPVVDSGWLYAAVSPLNDGNCVFAAAIPNPDPSGITSTGDNGRLVVAWFVDASGNLMRAQRALTTAARAGGGPPGSADEDALITSVGNYVGGNTNAFVSGQIVTVTTGCLNFSTWLSLDDPQQPQFHRLNGPTTPNGGIDWEVPASDILGPSNTTPERNFETSPGIVTVGGAGVGTTVNGAIAMPAAMRISVSLTGGGRFAPKGFLTGQIQNNQVPIAGLAVLPTTPGSMLRIDPDPSSGVPGGGIEWIEYSNYSGGKATIVQRGARRTNAGATHSKGDVVRVGVTYSLVRSLPR